MSDEPPLGIDPTKRPRGMLTTGDREALYKDPEGMSDQKRYRIRRRVQNGLVDFAILENYLPEKDRDLVFKLGGEQEDEELYHGIRKMFEFVYQGCDDRVDFEHMLETALYSAEISQHRLRGTSVDVDLTINIREHYDLDEAYEKYENEEPLSYEEIGALIAGGRIDQSELKDFTRTAQEQGYTPHFGFIPIVSVDDFLHENTDSNEE